MTRHRPPQSQPSSDRIIRSRTPINDLQREALRNYAFTHRARNGILPTHASLSQWWHSNYGSPLCQSVISQILSPEYTHLDNSGTPAHAWPELEAALWEWQTYTESQGGVAVSGEMLKGRAVELWARMGMYQGKEAPIFPEGWLMEYRQRHGTHTPRDQKAPGQRPVTMTMTQWLMDRDGEGFLKATQSSFLQAAGSGLVAKGVVERWLSQDRLYAQGYVKFIGMMLAKIRYPTSAGMDGLQWRLTDVLISALTNIRRELAFFEHVAKKYNLNLETPSPGQEIFATTPTTRAYLDLFGNVSGPNASILEGMTVLWATEKCYYSAWLFALHSGPRQQPITNSDPNSQADDLHASDLDGGALRKEFIPNWTNDEFGDFVHQLGALVNELAEAENERGSLDEEKRRCDEVWRQVLWLEAAFWPAVEERDVVGDVEELKVALGTWDREYLIK